MTASTVETAVEKLESPEAARERILWWRDVIRNLQLVRLNKPLTHRQKPLNLVTDHMTRKTLIVLRWVQWQRTR